MNPKFSIAYIIDTETDKRNYRCEYHVISKIGSNICLRSVNIKVLKN